MNAPSYHAAKDRLDEGTQIGAYEISLWIRDGGMASLYFAEDPTTEEFVAVKVISQHCASLPVTRLRFDREILLMQRLRDVPHVVRFIDAGLLPDHRPYLVIEWIEGSDLDDLLERQRDRGERLPLTTALCIARDIALAIVALHERGIIHRDIKPSNIMIGRGPNDHLATLVDFGIAADLEAAPSPDLTQGTPLGTEPYLAPEQSHGHPPLPSADLWSMGAVLLELLGGARAPKDLHTQGLPHTLDLAAPPDVAPLLSALLRRCLSLDPHTRPSATDFAQTIQSILDDLARATQALLIPSPRPPAQAGVLVATDPAHPPLPPRASAGGTVVSDVPLRVVGSPVGVTQRVEAEAPIPTASIQKGTVPNRRDTLPTATAAPVEPEAVTEEGTRDSKRILYSVLGVATIALLGLGVWRRAPTDVEEPIAREEVASKSAAVVVSVPGTEVPEIHETDAERMAEAQHVTVPPPKPLEDDPPPIPLHELELAPSATPKVTKKPPVNTKKIRQPAQSSTQKRRSPDSLECQAQRQTAEQAVRDRSWSIVLAETRRSECWSAATPRRIMRLEALLQLSRFKDCVEEGAKSSDPRILAAAEACRDLGNL